MREAEAVVDTITKEMTVLDMGESGELATAEEGADTVVRETCIFLSSLKSWYL